MTQRLPRDVRIAVEQGLAVVPQLPDKRAYFRWKAYQEQRPTRAEVKRWHRLHPDALWAVVTGKLSDRIVFDFDGDEGLATLKRLKLCPSVITPSGGAHVYACSPGWAVQGGARVDKRFPGMDLRADGQLATFFGENGQGRYQRADNAELYDFEDLPDELQQLLEARKRGQRKSVRLPKGFSDFMPGDELLREAMQRVKDGSPRNESGFWLACQARDERHDFDAAVDLVMSFADGVSSNGSHPYSRQEAYNSVVSAYSAAPRAPRGLTRNTLLGDGFHATDYGNAERLVAMHGDDLKYVHPWRSWLVWDDTRWKRDATAEVMRRAKGTVRALYEAAVDLKDQRARGALEQHAHRSESAGRIRAMVDMAASERKVVIDPDELDREPWLLNVENGTVDLRTGELRPHRKDDRLTKLVTVPFDADAEAPSWNAFLKAVLPDRSLRTYVQQAFGYSLTGLTQEQVFFILYGTGRNGKTTFLETLRLAAGEYAQVATTELLLAKKSSGIPSDVARLHGARFVSASEADEGRRLSEALVKQLTGSDRIPARHLYQDWFEFDPTHKIWLATNHKPQVRNNDEAIWRRIRLIPFEVYIKRADPNLPAKLRAELPGILAWAVRGAVRYAENGLPSCDAVEAATGSYRKEQDIFGRFLSECCEVGEGYYCHADELYGTYEYWCNVANLRPMSRPSFGRKLSDRGFEPRRVGHERKNTWFGVTLLDQPRRARKKGRKR